MKQNQLPFQKRIEPKQQKSFFQILNSVATSALNTLSSAIVPHYTYEGNPYIYNAVCDCLNKLDYSGLQYQCSNGIPHELRVYIWYALLLRPKDPWEIKNLYSETKAKEYDNLWATVTVIVDEIQNKRMQQREAQLTNLNNNLNNNENTNNTNNINNITNINNNQTNNTNNDNNNINQLDEKTVRVIECDVVRTFPEGGEYIFKNQPQIIDMLKRILLIYSYVYNNRGYFQGLNDICAIFIALFMERYLHDGEFTLPNENELKKIEVSVYYMLEAMMKKIYPGNETQFHVDTLWTDFIDLIEHQFGNYSFNSTYIINFDIIRQQTYRWFVCLFCREFNYQLTFAVWDNFFLKMPMKQFILQFAFAILVKITNSYNVNSFEDFNSSNILFFNDMKTEKLNSLITVARSYDFDSSQVFSTY